MAWDDEPVMNYRRIPAQIVGGGLYSVALRPLFKKYDVLTAVAWMYMMGACLILLSVLTWCVAWMCMMGACLILLWCSPGPAAPLLSSTSSPRPPRLQRQHGG